MQGASLKTPLLQSCFRRLHELRAKAHKVLVSPQTQLNSKPGPQEAHGRVPFIPLPANAEGRAKAQPQLASVSGKDCMLPTPMRRSRNVAPVSIPLHTLLQASILLLTKYWHGSKVLHACTHRNQLKEMQDSKSAKTAGLHWQFALAGTRIKTARSKVALHYSQVCSSKGSQILYMQHAALKIT